jgi:branched-chain amino acid transport system substrate-binding protein
LNALGYDTVKLIAHIHERAESSPASIKSALGQIRGFQGAAGSITFDENGDVVKDLQLMQVRSAQVVEFPPTP